MGSEEHTVAKQHVAGRDRGCACWTDYRNGDREQCGETPAKVVWRENGRVYWYCPKHAEQAVEWFPDAAVMDL